MERPSYNMHFAHHDLHTLTCMHSGVGTTYSGQSRRLWLHHFGADIVRVIIMHNHGIHVSVKLLLMLLVHWCCCVLGCACEAGDEN